MTMETMAAMEVVAVMGAESVRGLYEDAKDARDELVRWHNVTIHGSSRVGGMQWRRRIACNPSTYRSTTPRYEGRFGNALTPIIVR